MGSLSRRSLIIKGLGGLSALNLLKNRTMGLDLAESCPTDDKLKYLNIVLHGLFVVNFTENGIELLTPKIEEHQYHAGSWDRDCIYRLCERHTYTLYGITPSDSGITSPPRTGQYGYQDPHNYDCNVVLSRSRHLFTIERHRSYCFIKLPFPADIYLKRCLRPDNPSTLFSGPDAYLIKTKGISLCPVLTYPISKFCDLYLSGIRWKPKICDYGNYEAANLHFWAEPADRSNPTHTLNAYKKLMELLPPLQFQLVTTEMPPVDLVTGVRGLLPEEEQGWAEWQGGGGEGSRPTNCNPLMS